MLLRYEPSDLETLSKDPSSQLLGCVSEAMKDPEQLARQDEVVLQGTLLSV